MKDYLIECDVCRQDSRIISKEEPSFCPICGEDARPIVMDEEDEEDEDNQDDI